MVPIPSHNLLEISGDDIALLGDADLRNLIGLLCEADYRLAGLPTKGITWGGHQDAQDGGLDVVVWDKVSPPSTSLVPRSVTGFQVKKPDMPKSKIIEEMKPNGVLRPAIKTLVEEKGAYIIVSSRASTTERTLNNCLKAMREAMAGEDDRQNLHVDFLDRGRIATWVRRHYSLILWVRSKINRPLVGWRPYDNWANSPGGLAEEYIIDTGFRIFNSTESKKKELSVEEGINQLRSLLSTPGKSVRMTGLSGVGKTRLVQALFDQRLGEHPLDPCQAIYTDISDEPIPHPITIAEQLLNDQANTILIIDNCPPKLHRRLTEICSKEKSTVSLLTVEYDVREDLPEETDVFRLEPAGEELIEKLIRSRFAYINQIDASTIAKFSGGNARIAIALANTVKRGETLSAFNDRDLFERLFWQRDNSNESMFISAQACALVYSFEGTNITSEESELQFLAALVNKSGEELYRDVAELKRRELVQTRNIWRAVLPHALANHLAQRALEDIPKDILVGNFEKKGSKRLLTSFTRRLGFLHDSETAVAIINEWLAPDGLIGRSIDALDSFSLQIFINIAPIAPEKTLGAMERAANGSNGQAFTSRANEHYWHFTKLLTKIAYQRELFKRCVELLLRYALAEKKDENINSTREIMKPLFYIHYSGTHATLEDRALIIEQLLNSDDDRKVHVGLVLLDAALEIWQFSTNQEFEFGARPRDFGYKPTTQEETAQWFEKFISICTNMATSDLSSAEKARKILADKLYDLWCYSGIEDVLEKAAEQIHAKRPWNDGWIAARGTLRNRSNITTHSKIKLRKLIDRLRPRDLLEQARTYALSGRGRAFDLEDDYEDIEDADVTTEKVHEKTKEIGKEVAQNADILTVLLPELVATDSSRLEIFGTGLAEGTSDLTHLFDTLRKEAAKVPPDKRKINVFFGIIRATAEIDPSFCNSALDALVKDEVLGKWFPLFQTRSIIDARGVDRLHASLDLGITPVDQFEALAWGRAHESISDDDLLVLIKKIISKPEGFDIGLKIFQMKYCFEPKKNHSNTVSSIEIARNILTRCTFLDKPSIQSDRDYLLSKITGYFLKGNDSKATSILLCKNLAKAIMESRVFMHNYPLLLKSLAKTQPNIFLDTFLGDENIPQFQIRRMFPTGFRRQKSPLNQIPDDVLLSWCQKAPLIRYPLLTSTIEATTKSAKTGMLAWKPIVYKIINQAPQLSDILYQLTQTLMPLAWSGSYSAILESSIVLCRELSGHNKPEVKDWARDQLTKLEELIKEQCENEENNRRRNESFE